MKKKVLFLSIAFCALCSYVVYTYTLQRHRAHTAKKSRNQGYSSSQGGGGVQPNSPIRKLDPNFFDKK
jgi:hypothetical protein